MSIKVIDKEIIQTSIYMRNSHLSFKDKLIFMSFFYTKKVSLKYATYIPYLI